MTPREIHRHMYLCKGPTMTKPETPPAKGPLVLYRCRFCNSSGDYIALIVCRLGCFVYCRECKAQGPTAKSPLQATADWNFGWLPSPKTEGTP